MATFPVKMTQETQLQDLTNPVGIATSRTSTPVMFDLQSIIAKTNPISERLHRQRCLDAIILVADAWQTLVRKRKMKIARAVDEVAEEMFLSSWKAIAAEVFMLRRPERKDCNCGGYASSSTLAVVDEDGYGEADSTIQKAERLIVAAWDILEGLPGGGGRDADDVKALGLEQFGEDSFRAAMKETRGGGADGAFECFEDRCRDGPDDLH